MTAPSRSTPEGWREEALVAVDSIVTPGQHIEWHGYRAGPNTTCDACQTVASLAAEAYLAGLKDRGRLMACLSVFRHAWYHDAAPPAQTIRDANELLGDYPSSREKP